MTMLKQLLSITDLSAPSRHAAERAAMIARNHGATLELMHVLERGVLDRLRKLFGDDNPQLLTQLQDQARSELATLGAALHQSHSINASLRVGIGSLLHDVIERADALDADLVALGARGKGFIRHAVLGSTAERLLQKTTRPLLVVQQIPRVAYQHLLVAVDFSRWSLPALRMARAVAPSARLTLLHVFDVPMEGMLRIAGVDDEKIHHYRERLQREAVHELRRLASEAGLGDADCAYLAAQGDPTVCVLEQEQDRDIDLIVIGKHGTGMTEELLLGSVTRNVLNESSCDILVTQDSKKT